MFTKRTAAAVAGIGLALSLSACSSSGDTAETNAAYCESAANVQTEVAALRTLVTGGDATVDQVQEQRDAIASAVQDAQKQAGSLADSVQADIKAADDTFDAALQAIPGDATLPQAAASYAAAIQAWDASVKAIRTEVGCS
jgi:ABC-type transporter Mla subunit MlaD